MTKQPWLKFYPSDWRAEPSLRICSVAARGLWIEIICIMHDAEPCGSLVIGGAQVTVSQLAGLIGASQRQTQTLFDELERAKVFSRDQDGTIFSRRMRRDIAKADRDKANGGRGGNPKLKGGDKGGVNPPVKGQDKAQKPEARNQKPEARAASAASAPPTDRSALELTCRESFAGWCRTAAQKRLEEAPRSPPRPSSADTPTFDFGNGYSAPHKTIRSLWAKGSWLTEWGPRPDEDGCRVPRLLLEQATA